MSAKRKKKGKSTRQAPTRKLAVVASSPVPAPVLPTAEEVIGAVVASVAPVLFDEPSAGGSSTDDASAESSSTDSAPDPTPSGPRAVSQSWHDEHRVHPRAALSVAIGLESESHFFSGLSGDISEGGIFVQTYRDLPVGSDVEVHCELPGGELVARGRVRWHREGHADSAPPGVGIAFEELDDDEREIIHTFCASRAPLYYDFDHG